MSGKNGAHTRKERKVLGKDVEAVAGQVGEGVEEEEERSKRRQR